MKATLTAFLFATIASLPSHAARPTPADIERVADEAIGANLPAGAPGCAVSLLDHGQVILRKGYGLASLEHSLAIDPERTVFDIGSVSKQFTAASVLLLAAEGKLSLQQSVHTYIPELPRYAQTVTINDLLHHTSGIPDYLELMMLGGFAVEDHTTGEDALRAIARQTELDFPPGSRFSYSNSGYFLLGLIVERVGGMSLAKFAHERIFAPLGMTDTRYLDDHTAVVARRASSYEAGEDGFLLSVSNWEQVGDGAVQTTLTDLARWDANFYQPKVGGQWLLDQLQQRGVLADGKDISYARGLIVDTHRGQRRVFHGGAWMGFRAEMMRFPDQQVTAMALCNFGALAPTELLTQLLDVYLADTLAPLVLPTAETDTTTAPPQPLSDPERYTGLFASDDSGLVRRIEQREGKLWYVRLRPNGPTSETELHYLGADRFQMLGEAVPTPVLFSRDSAGAVISVRVGDDEDAALLQPVQPAPPTTAELSEYAGRYTSAVLDTEVTLSVVDGTLLLQRRRGPAFPLQPVFAGAFLSPAGLLRFERDAQGQPSGFRIVRPRARGLNFVREASP